MTNHVPIFIVVAINKILAASSEITYMHILEMDSFFKYQDIKAVDVLIERIYIVFEDKA